VSEKRTQVNTKQTWQFFQDSTFWINVFIVLFIAALYYVFEYSRHISEQIMPWFRSVVLYEYNHNMNGILIYISFFISAFTLKKSHLIFGFWLFTIISIYPHIISFSPDTPALFKNTLFLLSPLLVLTIINLEINWRKREKSIMNERDSERKIYMQQIIKTQENERKRIAQSLHDDISQTLIAVASAVQDTADKEWNDTNIHLLKQKLESIRDQVALTTEGVKRISLDLRPSVLDLGLLPAITWLADRLNEGSQIETQISISGSNRLLAADIETVVFRFIQEALNNIKLHANASKAVIILEYLPESLKISVVDNGKGFIMPVTLKEFSKNGKLGIAGMYERAELLGGEFHINSEINTGTTVSMLIKA
jgi:signal transduction histidine kinase